MTDEKALELLNAVEFKYQEVIKLYVERVAMLDELVQEKHAALHERDDLLETYRLNSAAQNAEILRLRRTLLAVLEIANIAAFYMPGELNENQQAVLDAIQQASDALKGEAE